MQRSITASLTRPLSSAAGFGITPPAQGILTLSGSSILGYDGAPVILRGVNFGAWGRELDTDPALYASWGANFVRLVMPRWWGLYEWLPDIDARDYASSATGNIKPAHLAIIIAMMAKLKAAGLYVQLEFDSDCGANGQQSQDEADYCRAAIGLTPGPGLYTNFWTDPAQLDVFIAAWVYLLSNLPIKPDIVGCLAEPNNTGANVKAMYQSVMDACLAVAPNSIFAMFGPGDGTGFVNVVFPERTNIIYEFNLLDGAVTNVATLPTKIAQNTDFRTTYNKPVYCDQIGTKDNTDPTRVYMNAGLSVLNANNISFAVWQNRAWSVAEGEYAIFYNPDSWTLRTDVRDRLINYCAQTYAILEAAAIAAATAASATLWYVKADLSNITQDGTTPVTTDGQSIGRIDPVVGSASLTQASAPGKPTLTTIVATGRKAVLFDGSTSYMLGSAVIVTSGGQFTAIAAGVPANIASTQNFIVCGNNSGTPKWPRLAASSASLASAAFQTDTTNVTVTGAISTAGRPCVLSCTRDSSNNKILYSMGLQDGSTNTTVDGAIATLDRLRVGSTASNTPNFNGPIALWCIAPSVLSASNRQDIERFGAFLAGSYYHL